MVTPLRITCAGCGGVKITRIEAQEREQKMAWYDVPDGWSVAGYDDLRGEWQDVWNGDPAPDPLELEMADSVVLHYDLPDGEDFWMTVHGGFDEDYSIADAIADAEDRYGIG